MKAQRITGSNLVTWGLAAFVVIGLVLLCIQAIMNNLSQALHFPLQVESGHLGLPRPEGGVAQVSSFEVNQVTVKLTHLSAQLKWMLVFRTILQYILAIGSILTFGIVFIRTSDGVPFAKTVTRSLFILALLVALAGTGVELLDTFIEQREVFEAIGNAQFGTYSSTFGGFHLGLSSLFIAAGIAVLATAFAIGARLTTERARLATETARLQRETEGLV